MINSFRGKYDFLSNFYPSSVYWDRLPYPSVEHAFQAAKTLDSKEREKIRRTPSAGTAKKLGRNVTLRENWNEYRLILMEELLRQKFTRHEWLQRALIETGDEHLEEGNYCGDSFWGTVNGVGENNLGKLLMKIRAEIAIDEVYKVILARMENDSAT